MREVLSLSLPAQTTKEIKVLSKRRGFASVSDYIRELINQDKDLISVDELVGFAQEADREYKASRTIKANSLADLL